MTATTHTGCDSDGDSFNMLCAWKYQGRPFKPAIRSDWNYHRQPRTGSDTGHFWLLLMSFGITGLPRLDAIPDFKLRSPGFGSFSAGKQSLISTAEDIDSTHRG